MHAKKIFKKIFKTVFRRSFRPLNFLLAVVMACSFASPLRAVESQAGAAAFLEKLSLSAIPSQNVTVCHGFGCAYRNQLVLTPAKLSYLRGTRTRRSQRSPNCELPRGSS